MYVCMYAYLECFIDYDRIDVHPDLIQYIHTVYKRYTYMYVCIQYTHTAYKRYMYVCMYVCMYAYLECFIDYDRIDVHTDLIQYM